MSGGLDGNGNINIAFERPIHWLGADYPGELRMELYRDGQFVFGGTFSAPNIIDNFAGLYSSEAFDTAILIDPGDEAAIDDMFFVIPAPSSFALLLLAAVRRRRARNNVNVLGTLNLSMSALASSRLEVMNNKPGARGGGFRNAPPAPPDVRVLRHDAAPAAVI